MNILRFFTNEEETCIARVDTKNPIVPRIGEEVGLGCDSYVVQSVEYSYDYKDEDITLNENVLIDVVVKEK